ncbi:nucleoporin [Rhodotorula toruloides]|uniref:BY PROTMAP: gi/472588188/gb/EMS25660.1/ nucleoporin [Rhodosporidium toruloides NP11] gi/647395974/emb/CDR37945.1/ RHTO0S03e01200g1_1 [Rhodosporidium toruloides] n=1 Tax=Rhodotorula toruloides TaxID=5286 RepID=A0A0K3CMG7_RHOTO|nr:nucleoporin [Rhodotorula toruloides]
MALVQADESPNSRSLSWANALVLLESAAVTGTVPPSASSFLSSHLAELQRPHDPFPRSTQSKTQLASGKLELAKRQVEVAKEEQTAALEVADRFSLDEVEAFLAVRSARREKGKAKAEKLSEDEWDRVTALTNSSADDDTTHPCYDLASTLLPSILSDTFTSTLLSAFASRTSQSLPEAVRASPAHSLFWTKQLVREQKALLELVFLVYYSPRPADGPELARVLDIIKSTEWGQRQELFGYFDAETQGMEKELADLLTLIAIEAMNLENAMEQEYPIGAPGEQGVDPKSIFAPAHLIKVNEAVEALVRLDSERSSPVLIGWAFLLSKVTTSLLERGVPESYHDFAEQSLRVEAPSSSSSRSSTQPLFQLYAAHALSPASSLFPVLLSILRSPLLGQSAQRESFSSFAVTEPNAVGYLSVLRGLVTSLPNLIRLPFLTSTQLNGLYEVFSALYGNPSSALLCAQFWEDQAVVAAAEAAPETSMLLDRTAQSAGEAEIVELARSRFPIQFGGLVSLVRSLTAGVAGLLPPDHADGAVASSAGASTDDELLAAKCAQSTFAYLATLPTLTHVVPSGPSVTPLPYETATYPDPDTGYSYRVSRPIGVSRSVVIPTGVQGRLISQHGTKPVVVAWDVEWSAWRLFADVLEDYAGMKRPKVDVFGSKEASTDELPMSWDSEEEQERDVTAVLDILRITLRNDHTLAPALIDHLSSSPGRKVPPGTAPPRYDLVEVLFRILERSLTPNPNRPAPTALVSSLVGLVAALLPSFPGIVWTFLRGSALLFPSSKMAAYSRTASIGSSSSGSAILQAEKLAGQCPVTLSLLSLVHALVLEEQVAACVTSAEYRDIKHGVLVRALGWIRDEIWPMFGSWRFASLAEKYELAKRCMQLYKLVMEEGEVAGASPVVQVVTDALLSAKATVAQLSPLSSTLAGGPDGILLLRKAGRYADAQALEDLVDSALGLSLGLLRLRRRSKSATSSLFEKLCLSPSSAASFGASSATSFGFSAVLSGQEPTRRPELLESLARFVVAPLDTKLAVQAARLVSLLCLGSSTDDEGASSNGRTSPAHAPASMSTLLGGSDGVEKIVLALLAVADDSFAAQDLKVAVWDLISSVVDSQPGLALLVVTGRAYPYPTAVNDPVPASAIDDKGKTKEATPAEKSVQELAKSLAPKPPQPLPRTAISLALEKLASWSDSWKEEPAVLAAVLRFLDFTWQHMVDFGTALDDLRTKGSTWDSLVKIAFESIGPEPAEEDSVAAYCHRAVAHAHAVRVVALDVQGALSKPKPEDAASTKALLSALGDSRKVKSAVTHAIATSCAPDLHQGIYALVQSAFPNLHLDTLRNPASPHPLDDAREFGTGYLYAIPLVRRRLDGYMADPDAMIAHDTFENVIAQTAKLNLNFSLLEAQILATRSWRQLLEVVSPLMRKDVAAVMALTASSVAGEIAQESRAGQVMLTVQAERLSILLAIVQVLAIVDASKSKDVLVDLITDLAAVFSNEALDPLESVARRATPAFHATLFRAIFFVVRQVNALEPSTLAHEQKTKVSAAIESLLRDMFSATRDLLAIARATKDVESEQDLVLAVVVVSQLLASSFVPPAPVWLAHIHSIDLLRSAFEVFVNMDQSEPGRPLCAQHVLDLCLAFATSSPRAAEQLPLDGAMTALTDNALTSVIEAGAVSLVSPTDGARTPQHEIWTGMLRLVVALVSALGDSTRFVEQDVTGFVRLYGMQIVQALSWTFSTPVTAAGLEELSAVVSLMHGIAKSSIASGVSPNSPVVAVANVFVEQSLHLLQHLVYALLHPNHLAALIEGLTAEERGWLEKESSEADVEKRPVAAAVTLKMVELARDVVGALVDYSDAWGTLLKDSMDWKVERAVVLPTATVTASDKASLGTLFDLCSYCIDTLRSTTSTAAPSLPSPSPFPTLSPPSQASLRNVCSEMLEASLLLATTQLGLHARQGGQGTGFVRTLGELGSETAEIVDKALGLTVPGTDAAKERNRKALLEVLKRRLTL